MDLQRFPDQAENLLNSRMIHLVPEMRIRLTGTDQITEKSLLELMRDGETFQLKELSIAGGVLYVTPYILVGVAMRVEILKARLSSAQVENILIGLADSEDSRLRRLEIFGGPVNLSSLEPEVLAGALTKLETVGLNLSLSLSPLQVSALFSRICQAPVMRITELVLRQKDLSLMPPEVLVGAIQRLEKAEFRGGLMTAEQLTAILTIVKERRLGRIKRISINSVDGMRDVSYSLIKEAKLNQKLAWDWLTIW